MIKVLAREKIYMILIRFICVLLFWISATASYAELDQNDIKLLSFSVVCDPPRLHSSDPLGIRTDQKDHDANASINAFELEVTSSLDAIKQLKAGTISGSFKEVLVPIEATKNRILFSSTSVNILHAIELTKSGAFFQAQLYLIDKRKLETMCYETYDGYFD